MIQTKPRGRAATAHEINAAEMRAKRNEHTHAYFNHPTSPRHFGCACGWMCLRDFAPEDLVFVGPASPVRR